jgi:hypothetical protein
VTCCSLPGRFNGNVKSNRVPVQSIATHCCRGSRSVPSQAANEITRTRRLTLCWSGERSTNETRPSLVQFAHRFVFSRRVPRLEAGTRRCIFLIQRSFFRSPSRSFVGCLVRSETRDIPRTQRRAKALWDAD